MFCPQSQSMNTLIVRLEHVGTIRRPRQNLRKLHAKTEWICFKENGFIIYPFPNFDGYTV